MEEGLLGTGGTSISLWTDDGSQNLLEHQEGISPVKLKFQKTTSKELANDW